MDQVEINQIISEAINQVRTSFSVVDYRDMREKLREIFAEKGFELIENTDSICIRPFKERQGS